MTPFENRPPSPEADEIDLRELLAVVWAGKTWIVGAMVCAFVYGAVSALQMQPIYKAEGILQLEVRSSSLALPTGMQDLLGGGGYTGNSPGETEMEIMKSRMVMSQVARDLDLQIYAYPRPLPFLGLIPARLNLPDLGLPGLRAYQWGNEHIKIGELELPQEWINTDLVLKIADGDSYSLELPNGTRVTGNVQQRLSLPLLGVSLVVDELEGPPGRQFFLGRMDLNSAIGLLQGNFSVAEAPRYSSILRVEYTDPDPRRAEAILDAISQAYITQNITRSAAEAQNSLEFIEEQLPTAEQAVTTAQNALNAYRQERLSVDVEYETRILLERATQIESELSALAIQEDELKVRYTVNHPTYQAFLQNRAALQAQLDALREETADLPETQKEIFNLTRSLEVAQEVYVQLLNRAQELRVVRASTVGSVRIIDSAFSNNIRIEPRTSRIVMLHVLGGLVLGLGFVIVRKMLRQGIQGAQDIEHIGLPVFATINYSPEAAKHRKLQGSLPILALTRPDDIVVEALRSLRTSLHFGMIDAETNTVLFTSAAPEAGKSFTAVNLAVVAAQAGQRVCLIDADMRKGYLNRYFGCPKGTPGLAEYLAREKSLDDVLLPGAIDGLSVILSGRYPPNPSELLMRADFEDLLKTLHASFDLVIIDSPPTLAVTDPVVIGRSCGASILVVRHMETVPAEINAVLRAFENGKTKLTGAILNGYKANETSTYGGAYGAYSYRYSYKRDAS